MLNQFQMHDIPYYFSKWCYTCFVTLSGSITQWYWTLNKLMYWLFLGYPYNQSPAVGCHTKACVFLLHKFELIDPWEILQEFFKYNFETDYYTKYQLVCLLWNCFQVNATETHYNEKSVVLMPWFLALWGNLQTCHCLFQYVVVSL